MENQPDFSDQPFGNPYAAASMPANPELRPPSGSGSENLPTFSRVYFIIDLVFCAIRAVLVLFAIVNIQNPAVANDPMVASTSLFEIATGMGMVLLGIPANILMLLKQRIGVYLAALKIVATLGTFGVGIWQLGFIMDRFPAGAPERVGVIMGAVIAMLVRLALLGVYVAAIATFVKWLDRRERKALAASK